VILLKPRWSFLRLLLGLYEDIYFLRKPIGQHVLIFCRRRSADIQGWCVSSTALDRAAATRRPWHDSTTSAYPGKLRQRIESFYVRR